MFILSSKFSPLSISMGPLHRIPLPSPLLNLNIFSNLTYAKYLTTSYATLIPKLVSLAHLSPLNQFTHPNVHKLLPLARPSLHDPNCTFPCGPYFSERHSSAQKHAIAPRCLLSACKASAWHQGLCKTQPTATVFIFNCHCISLLQK